MTAGTNRKLILRRRPQGPCRNDDFEMIEEPIRALSPGEVLIQTRYLSVDPTNRIWMSDMPQYMPPVQEGEVMRAGGLGEVVASSVPQFSPGDWVEGLLGWQSHGIVPAAHLSRLPEKLLANPTLALGMLGMTGCTAYVGLMKYGHPKTGETLVVSAAAGAVGSVAGQIGKRQGCRVVGIVGNEHKASWIVNELGFDATINYKTEDVAHRLSQICPQGVDIYFDNVGGVILDSVLLHMNRDGRIPLCGLISSYNATEPVPGPRHFAQILMQRLTVQGFIIVDHVAETPQIREELLQWHLEGNLKSHETIMEGLENAPRAVNALFAGENLGKLILRVA